jgi:hypothetical protein
VHLCTVMLTVTCPMPPNPVSTTCPTTLDPVSLFGRVSVLPYVTRLWTLPPCSGGL